MCIAFEENNFKQRHLWTTDLEGKTKRVTEGDWNRQRLRAECRRQAHRDAAHAEPAARVHRSQRSVGDGCERIEREAADHQQGARGQRLALSGWLDRAVHVGSRANRATSTTTTSCSWCPPPAARRRSCCPNVDYGVENASWSKDGKTHLLHREHGHAQRDHARERGDEGGRAAHQGRSQSRRLVLRGRQRTACVHAEHVAIARARSTRWRAGARAEARDAVFDDDLAKFKTARQEKITWKGQDGVTIEGLLTYPLDYKAGTEVSADRADARRPGGVGSVWLLDREPGLRREGLRGAAAELSRQHGLRRHVPARHGERLLQAVASRRDDGHRRRDRDGRRRSRPSS